MSDQGTSGPQVLVVDDSAFMRTVIADTLEAGGMRVVGEAADGSEAIDLVCDLAPDVVTMDIEMAGMGGIEAVERIMDLRPTPIVMLSAYAEEHADVTFEALNRGAIDFLAKPGGEVSAGLASLETDLVRTVRSLADIDPNSLSAAIAQQSRDSGGPSASDVLDQGAPTTVVIGASTGGPGVVESVVAGLPPGANLRVLIVQHMPAPFTARFADRLDTTSRYRVYEASDGLRIGRGEVVVARGGQHMVLDGYAQGRLRIGLIDTPPKHGVKPAVDVTMESVANTIDDPVVGVILTGMGGDGAEGIRAIKRAGGRTLAQDERTSTVFGMPKRAIETGAVDAVVPAADVVEAILTAVREVTVT